MIAYFGIHPATERYVAWVEIEKVACLAWAITVLEAQHILMDHIERYYGLTVTSWAPLQPVGMR